MAIHKSYGETKALHNVDLNVKSGTFLTLLGLSGNGKPGGRHFVRFTTDEQAVQIPAGSLS